MEQVTTIGLDIAKHLFHAHGADERGNALRSHMAELGWVAPKGLAHIARLSELVEDPASGLPEPARPVLRMMLAMLTDLDGRIAELDREIARRAREDEAARLLMRCPASALSPPRRCSRSRRRRPPSTEAATLRLPAKAGAQDRLRCLAGAGAAPALEQRQGAAWRDHAARRTHAEAAADPGRERGRAARQQPRRTGGILAGRQSCTNRPDRWQHRPTARTLQTHLHPTGRRQMESRHCSRRSM